MGLSIRLPSCWLVFVQGWGENGWGLLLAGVAFTGGGEPHSLSSPPHWLKADAGVGHSLAMWSHPLYLKHWREFGSNLLAVPSFLVLVSWLPCPLLPFPVPPAPCPVGKLWAWVVIEGHLYHCGSLGNWGCYYHCIPSYSLSPRGYLVH